MYIVLTLGFGACQSIENGKEKESEFDHHDDHDHVHDYACPMHPNLQGHEGEKCNSCGMPLEKIKDALEVNYFIMDFHASHQEIVAESPVSLFFQPRNVSNSSLAVPLDVTHEKKIHLFIVSESLTWFDHIHPEYLSDGSYTVETIFPSAGNYLIFANYQPSGHSELQERFELLVSGKKASPKSYQLNKTIGQSGVFTVELIPKDPTFYAQSEIHFDGIIKVGGKEYDANELLHYFGAVGHLVAIHVDSKTLVHIHPIVENEKLHFHTVFPLAGKYRMWLQFREPNKVHTIDYVIDVEPRLKENPSKLN